MYYWVVEAVDFASNPMLAGPEMLRMLGERREKRQREEKKGAVKKWKNVLDKKAESYRT